MPAFSSPLTAEATDPIKKFGEWIHYVIPFLRNKTKQNNNNGTQGNNKVTTTTIKDREQEQECALAAGRLQVWAKGYSEVHEVDKEANQKALLDGRIIANFLFFFLALFSPFFQP